MDPEREIAGEASHSVEVFSEREFVPAVADEIVASINEVLDEKEYCSLVLSGGTTPAAIYRLLGMPPRLEEIEWERLKIFWGDERLVPADDTRSNFRLANETLLPHVRNRLGLLKRIETESGTPEEIAHRYGDTIRAEGYYPDATLQENPFDLVLLGVGADGHFASVFPGEKLSADLCYATEKPEDRSPRITIHPSALLRAERILFLVKGAEKAQVIERYFTGAEGDATAFPLLHVKNAAGKVIWFLDSAASADVPFLTASNS